MFYSSPATHTHSRCSPTARSTAVAHMIAHSPNDSTRAGHRPQAKTGQLKRETGPNSKTLHSLRSLYVRHVYACRPAHSCAKQSNDGITPHIEHQSITCCHPHAAVIMCACACACMRVQIIPPIYLDAHSQPHNGIITSLPLQPLPFLL